LIDMSAPPRRSRRRATVFLCAFIPALAASLTYVYLRPAEYRAVARLHIAPAAAVTQPTEAKDTPTVTTDAKSFLTEVQVLTSRPLLQNVLERLKSDDALPDLGPDPIETVQGMLSAEPVAGTQVVELSAEGRQPRFVARLVNTVVDAYRQHVAAAYNDRASSSYGDVSNEASALDNQVAARRQAIDAFRARYDIVSMEHKENDVLANIEGLSQSYTQANGRLAKAQAHLQTLRAAAAAGKGIVKDKDNSMLADLERRVSGLHELWGEEQRRYTATYLAIDPDARSLQARLENLEGQLTTQRAASVRAALAEAEEELSAAQAAVEQLRRDVADNQKEAQEFATHLNEYKALREDLDHLEAMHRAALDRLTKLQASEQERAPRVDLVEAAAPSSEPWRPNYRQDALIAVAGSLAFGLFATWFADFIAGPPMSPAMLVQHAWAPTMLGRDLTSAPLSLAAPGIAQLPAPEPLPRELVDAEIAALVAAATEDARLVVVALLMGLSAEELAALRWDEIDLPAGIIRVADGAPRAVPLLEPLHGLLVGGQRAETGVAEVFRNAQGARLEIAEVERLVLYAAYDAALDRPQEITPAALRYTYLCFLIRQGIRAADIADAAGPVPQKQLIACMQINSPRERRPLELIDRVLPALRELGGGGIA
jgi:polysaccharide biosynthesis transport protein